jgi:hypothetical protein
MYQNAFMAVALGLGLGFLSACATGPSDNYSRTESVQEATERTPAADTATDVIRENGPRVNLEKCGGRDGSARMVRNSTGDLFLRIEKMDCGYYKTMFMSQEAKLNGSQGSFGIDIPVDEDVPGWHTLTFGSKNYFNNPKPGSKADILRFYVPARTVVVNLVWDGSQPPQRIPHCGGTVEGKINNGTVNLIFRKVENCNQLKVSNGVDSKSYPLNAQGEYFGGSFSVPKNMVDLGANTVNLYLNGARHEARVQAKFIGAFSW